MPMSNSILTRMTIQFIGEANQRNFQTEQVLPSVFTETLYIGCPWLYLIHNRGTKYKVWLRKVSGTNSYALFSNERKKFLHDSKYSREQAKEMPGNNGRHGRVSVNLEHNRVGVMVSGIRVSTVTQRRVDLPGDRLGHVFSGQGCHILAQVENLEVGKKLIFTNLLNNTVSMVSFNDSGIALRVENVPRMPLNQQRPFVKSPADKEPHVERADNNNHMNIKTNWRDIVHECDFKTNKMVRFKQIYDDVVDILETNDQLDPVKIPLFDIC
ncbi:hypothetical protein Tco_0911125 [Tanacetum coccineum]|uniref:Uncharacterized protein n=1 Tax=Tanacetum coccineum TaxID=301880 RepID=A0ABQ5CVW6_9ASTR